MHLECIYAPSLDDTSQYQPVLLGLVRWSSPPKICTHAHTGLLYYFFWKQRHYLIILIDVSEIRS